MIKFSSSFKLNEIHGFDCPFNEDSENKFFSREALISGEGQQEIFIPLRVKNFTDTLKLSSNDVTNV